MKTCSFCSSSPLRNPLALNNRPTRFDAAGKCDFGYQAHFIFTRTREGFRLFNAAL